MSINDNALPSVLIIRDTSDDFHCVMIVISGYSLYYRSVQESNTEGDLKEYRRLAGPRRRSLRRDKQQWAEQIVSPGESHLLNGEIKDAFGKFRQLRHKRTATSAPLMSTDGSLLSDKVSVMTLSLIHI